MSSVKKNSTKQPAATPDEPPPSPGERLARALKNLKNKDSHSRRFIEYFKNKKHP